MSSSSSSSSSFSGSPMPLLRATLSATSAAAIPMTATPKPATTDARARASAVTAASVMCGSSGCRNEAKFLCDDCVINICVECHALPLHFSHRSNLVQTSPPDAADNSGQEYWVKRTGKLGARAVISLNYPAKMTMEETAERHMALIAPQLGDLVRAKQIASALDDMDKAIDELKSPAAAASDAAPSPSPSSSSSSSSSSSLASSPVSVVVSPASALSPSPSSASSSSSSRWSSPIVLDFGCGVGRLTPAIARAVSGRAIGIEMMPNLLAQAPPAPSCEYRLLTAGAPFPVRDAEVDVVLTCFVLGCVPDGSALRQVSDEIYRVLQPGGLLFIVECISDKIGQAHYTYRTVDQYAAAFPWANLYRRQRFDEVGEDSSILVGYKPIVMMPPTTATTATPTATA